MYGEREGRPENFVGDLLRTYDFIAKLSSSWQVKLNWASLNTNTNQLNLKQLKVTKVEVRYSSHMDFENGVIVKIYKS